MRRALGVVLVCGAALAAAGCGAERPGRDLLAGLAEADLRADRLSLTDLAGDPLFERRGWSPLEHTDQGPLAWTLGGAARLRLPFHTAGDKLLRFRARAHGSLGPELPLSVSLNGASVGDVVLGTDAREIRLPLPASAQLAGDNDLELRVPRYREPDPADPDGRRLAVAVTDLEIGPIGSDSAPGLPSRDGDRLVLMPGSSASWYLRLEPGARLRLDASAGAGGQGQLGVRLETDGGEELVRSPGAVAGTETLPLPAAPGTLLRLEVSNPGDGLVWLDELRLTWDPVPVAPTRAVGERPGVLLYVVDTLRADRLGVYGHRAPTSPRLDAFASEALVFEDASAQASWTRPATASMLTGLHPSRHGADREDAALSPEQTTLAELLRAEGYRCGAFVANHLIGGRFGFEQGFDTWNGGDPSLYGGPAALLGERALAWLDGGEGPFLLYVHTMEPHSPYDPPPEAMAPFEIPEYEGDRDTRALLRLGQLGELSPDGLRFLEARYAGEIRANDAAFGSLLDGLGRRGLLESTVVVFVSDHGEELLDHGGTEHAKTLYQELVRIPLLVRLPGPARRAARVAEPVQQIDLLPSLLGLAGLAVPPGLPGRDLSGRWAAPAGDRAMPPPLIFSEERFTVTDKLAVRSGALKLILNNDGPELWRGGTHFELYDLAQDPREGRNLDGTRPVAEAFLRQELERFRSQAPGAGGAATLELTPEEQEQLRALGYVQ